MPKVIKPMSRVLIRFMLVICCGWTVTAQGQTLVLHHADGSTTDVKLFVAPKVTFEGEKLHIQSPVVDMQFTVGDVVRYSFESDDTAGLLAICRQMPVTSSVMGILSSTVSPRLPTWSSMTVVAYAGRCV